jgi:hypothetical protein
VKVEFESSLVESAVALALARLERKDPERYRLARSALDRAYDVRDARREETFARVHAELFAALELGLPVSRAIDEAGSAIEAVHRVLVKKSLRASEEESELFVREDGPGRVVKSLLLPLRPETLFDAPRCLRKLRHELRLIADMLDPAFAYDPRAGSRLSRTDRDRVRVLWHASVDGRIAREGKDPEESAESRARDIARCFPGWNAQEVERMARRLREDGRPAHAELLALALGSAERGDGSPAPGSSCPLCKFPTHDWAPEPQDLPCAVVSEIERRYRGWTPARGLCRSSH